MPVEVVLKTSVVPLIKSTDPPAALIFIEPEPSI
jgi:hypothetical protein